MPGKCNRGVVLEVNLDPSIGSEYMKTRPCLVVQSDLRTVDESRLGKVYGQVKPETMRQVAAALRIVLDLQEDPGPS